MRLAPIVVAIVFAIFLASTRPAEAQVVTVPTFPTGTDTVAVDVAGTYSGLYFLRKPTSGGALYLQRVGEGPWDPPQVVNLAGPAGAPAIVADGQGTFTVGWQFADDVWVRFLDVLGTPTGTPLRRSDQDGFLSGVVRMGALTAGAAVVWAESLEGVHLRAQIGPRHYDELASGPLDWAVATTPTGGCVVTWRAFNGLVESMGAQIFDANGAPVTGTLELAMPPMTVSDVAVSPVGDVMALVGVLPTVSEDVREIRVQRFDSSGALVGAPIVVGFPRKVSYPVTESFVPKAEYDFAGNLYVVYGDTAVLTAGVRARAYAPDGSELGPAVTVATEIPSSGIRTTRLPNGEFANTWVSNHTAYANVVSLCPPGSATCGDGVLVPACERCDDGAGNDDGAPNACRTNCLPAHCGDGTPDAGEECDDGNFDRCDGCGADCRIEAGFVCGDGVTSASCGEQCDDGNAVLLDGCTPACMLERIQGGGSPEADCLAEWTIDNPTTVPARDKRGGINPNQRCVDDDPRCDFDGGTLGSCTFHVRVCGNNTDLPACRAPTRLSSWIIDKPSAREVAKRPALALVRETLATVPGAIVGPNTPDVCSGVLPIILPLKVTGDGSHKRTKVVLQTRATSYEGVVDKDKIRLECVPAGS